MKAEHRHELKTNALADMLGRTWRTIKAGPSRHGLLLLGIGIGIVIIAGTVYYLWQNHKQNNSALWVKVDDIQRKIEGAADPADVTNALQDAKSTAEKNPGTVPSRGLRFLRARTLLRQGLSRLGDPDKREDAVKDVEEARKAFSELANDKTGKDNDPLLSQEALLSVAVADESLGKLDEALKGYKAVTEKFRDSFAGKAAQDRINELEKSDYQKEVAELYEKLGEVVKLPPLDNTK